MAEGEADGGEAAVHLACKLSKLRPHAVMDDPAWRPYSFKADSTTGATWLPADHPSTVAARELVEELVAAAVTLVAERQGIDAAQRLKRTFGGGRISVKGFQSAVDRGIPNSTCNAFASELSVCLSSDAADSTIAHEVSNARVGKQCIGLPKAAALGQLAPPDYATCK